MKTSKDWETGQQIMALIADYTPTHGLVSVRIILNSEVKRDSALVLAYETAIVDQQNLIHEYKQKLKETDDPAEQIGLQDSINSSKKWIKQYRQQCAVLEREAARKKEISRKLSKVIDEREDN